MNSRRKLAAVLLIGGGLLGCTALGLRSPAPAAKRIPVTEEYHGTGVTEDYRWLESWQDPEVRAWSEAQNAHARSILDKLPGVEPIREQVTRILAAETVSYGELSLCGETPDARLFAIKREPPRQQPFLVVLESWNDDPGSARVLVDPDVLDPGGTTSIDWYQPSPDGSLVAVSLSEGGTETGNLHLYDVKTGRELEDSIPHVNSGTAGGSLAWMPDGSGFFYTRHFKVSPDDPEDQSVYQHVYFHTLGTPLEQDRYELGEGFPQISEIQLAMDRPSGWLLATVQKGDGGDFAHHLRSADGVWRQFSDFGDGIKQAVFGGSEDLYIVTLRDAPRGKILRVSRDSLDLGQARTIIPQGDDAIVTSGVAFWGERTVLPTESRLYVVYQLGGPSEIRVFDHSGNALEAPEQLQVSAVHGLLPVGGDDILFANVSYLEEDAYYHYSAETGETEKTALASEAPVSFEDTTVVRESATSRDGTKVPLNIILRKGAERDGSNPCLAYGYGGYGVNVEPRFRPLNRLLLDRGMIYVVANLRGGGEFGEEWHRQGNLTNKQNVFDDFAAVLQHLIERGYTRPSKLAILGGSNGGLLMGATLTQHPELVQAVVSYVGIYDMLRVELSPNGAFNITEFGTVRNPEQFQALYAYSPYHNVKDGVRYPATLFLTGANDPRVDPMQSRKMTARLQAATAADAPILLRTSDDSGHGSANSLSERIEQAVDVYAFLFSQLGVDSGSRED